MTTVPKPGFHIRRVYGMFFSTPFSYFYVQLLPPMAKRYGLSSKQPPKLSIFVFIAHFKSAITARITPGTFPFRQRFLTRPRRYRWDRTFHPEIRKPQHSILNGLSTTSAPRAFRRSDRIFGSSASSIATSLGLSIIQP